jgi:hypothetical protein
LRVTVKSLIPKPRFLPGTFLDRLIGVRRLTSILKNGDFLRSKKNAVF